MHVRVSSCSYPQWDGMLFHVVGCISYRLSERCSHVAAVIFKVESAVRNGYTAATSSLCQWNQIISKKVSYTFIIFHSELIV